VQLLKVVDFFKGNFEVLSNFYPCEIHHDGLIFPSVEHAFVASKTKSYSFKKKISLLEANQAGLAKRFGRSVKLRDDWDIVKLSIMRRLLEQKFSLNELKTLLLSTGDATLIEGNYWHDNYWGDCRCKRCLSIEGKNNLGKLLMKVRGIL
jgi:ribA/ribD-fused uncharacterized protein